MTVLRQRILEDLRIARAALPCRLGLCSGGRGSIIGTTECTLLPPRRCLQLIDRKRQPIQAP